MKRLLNFIFGRHYTLDNDYIYNFWLRIHDEEMREIREDNQNFIDHNTKLVGDYISTMKLLEQKYGDKHKRNCKPERKQL